MGASFFISEANHFLCPWVLHLLCSEANHFLCPCMGASFFISEAEISISHLGFFENRIGQQHFFIKNNLFISQHSQGNVTRRPRPPHFKKAPTTFQNQRPWNDKTALPRLRDKAPPPPAFQKKPRPHFKISAQR